MGGLLGGPKGMLAPPLKLLGGPGPPPGPPSSYAYVSSRSHPRHLLGKRTAQKDTIIDITSDSQVNSNFPYRWSPASLTFNNHFYLFLYLYITWITINNNAPHLKSPKNQNRRAALGRPAIQITEGLQLVCGRPKPNNFTCPSWVCPLCWMLGQDNGLLLFRTIHILPNYRLNDHLLEEELLIWFTLPVYRES